MRVRQIIVVAALTAVAAGSAVLTGQQAPAPAPPAAAAPATGPGGQTVPTFFPPNYIGWAIAPPAGKVPDGFTPIFNGTNLSGWHVSRTNHHGRTPDFFVMHGMIVATQSPLGGGGILLTDKKYKNFELYMEVKPDFGNDSGIFLRSTESGAAYQVTMDFLPNGSMGNVIGEGGMQLAARGRGAAPGAAGAAAGRAAGAAPAAAAPAGAGAQPAAGRQAAAAPAGPPPGFGEGNQATAAWVKVWKRDDWNAVRVRMTGEVPHVTVWFNDVQLTDFQDTANSAIGGITEGPIAIQVHGQQRWTPGGFWRWRNIAIKELP